MAQTRKIPKPGRPLLAALATLAVLLAVSLLVWLAAVRPQLGKGRTLSVSDDFKRIGHFARRPDRQPDLYL